jgi:DNA replication and repair protein RecF
MQLEKVEASNFRNLAGYIETGNRLNIMVGDNGQGKTNWLEAIHLLATARSFKTARLTESIRFGEDLAIVRGRVRQSQGIHRQLQVALQANTRTLYLNGKKTVLNEYLGELHSVSFTSDELSVIRGHPDSRRRFLDDAIVSLHPPFIQTFTDYGRVIKQKNSLLQKARDSETPLEKVAESLEPWNQQIVNLAARIHRGRMRIVDRLNEALEKRLFGSEEIGIRYVSSLEGKGDLDRYEGLLAERLKLRVQAEVIAGHALVGPHRDDLEITFDGLDLRKYGSAGQQRSALLLLLLANIAVFHATRGEYPLFLLDDIDAELDYQRIGQLLDYLSDKTQTFVTTSKHSFVENFGAGSSVFSVTAGTPKTL